jgi:hypothetical protein
MVAVSVWTTPVPTAYGTRVHVRVGTHWTIALHSPVCDLSSLYALKCTPYFPRDIILWNLFGAMSQSCLVQQCCHALNDGTRSECLQFCTFGLVGDEVRYKHHNILGGRIKMRSSQIFEGTFWYNHSSLNRKRSPVLICCRIFGIVPPRVQTRVTAVRARDTLTNVYRSVSANVKVCALRCID